MLHYPWDIWICFQLQQQHHLQQQILRQQYQAQERQLTEMHEQQLHQLKVSSILKTLYIYIYTDLLFYYVSLDKFSSLIVILYGSS